jgi:hypothetical protein
MRAAYGEAKRIEETHLLLIEPTGTPNTGAVTTAAPRRRI